MKSAATFFERVSDIRSDEAGLVLRMSIYLLLIIASYSITKAVRDSLFVTNIGPAQLPYVYLLIAGAMGVVSTIYSRTVNRVGLHRLIRITSLIAISNLVCFWFLFKNNSSFWFYVLYVWASLFGAITASQFWLLATHVFNPREARRLFSWVGLGGIFGGIVGGGLTSRMAHWFGTESLLILCAGMMTATLVLLEQVGAASREKHKEESFLDPTDSAEETSGRLLFRQIRQSKHLTMMVSLLVVAVIVEAFIDYEYKVVAKQSISSKDHLTAFFGTVTFYIGILSLLFQIFVTNRILKRFGVGWAILLLPAGLLASFSALAMRPVLWAAALLQLVDGAFSYSIHRSGMELLYLPIPPETRNPVKGFIDMFVDRTGRAIGAVLLLMFTAGLALSTRWLSVVACGLVLLWIVMAIVVKREYLQSFRQALEKKTVEPEAMQLRGLDSATMKSLLRLLSSDDERQVLYALDLLSNTHPNRWRDQVNRLIRHSSSAVRARAIALLATANDASIAGDEFIHHPDYETSRIATASALRLQWTGSQRDRARLHWLLEDSSTDVVRQAITTSATVGYREALPLLISKLGDRRLRRDAREALLKMGAVVIPELIRRLSSANEEAIVRRRIPKTLALTGRQKAADALMQQLHCLGYDLDFAVIKALNRMRVNSPQIVFDAAPITDAIDYERQQYDWLRAIRISVESSPSGGQVQLLLLRALSERLEQRLERIFRLIGLIYSPHDIYSVYYNCRVKPALRPAAIEFLDNLLDSRLKEGVVPLLEEAFDAAKGGSSRPTIKVITPEAASEMLIIGDDDWLKIIARETKNELREIANETRDRRLNTH